MTSAPSSAPASHETLVTAQFGPRAAAYVTSAVHARGEDLDALAQAMAGRGAAQVLDLGCGGGHAGFAVAPHVARVVAYDLSRDMLAAVEGEAAARGLSNVETVQGGAEALPFPDAAFDVVVSRFSAHHWRDFAAGLRAARRVLKPGGVAIFMDVVAPADAVLDTFLQGIELLRDPSHGRDYSVAQWIEAARAAGFNRREVVERRLRLDFTTWIARMKTPEVHVAAIRSLQAGAAQQVRNHFAIEADGTFTLDTASMTFDPV